MRQQRLLGAHMRFEPAVALLGEPSIAGKHVALLGIADVLDLTTRHVRAIKRDWIHTGLYMSWGVPFLQPSLLAKNRGRDAFMPRFIASRKARSCSIEKKYASNPLWKNPTVMT